MKKSNQTISDPRKYLRSVDPILAVIIDRIELPTVRIKKRSRFETLVESIVSQQLSVKASDTIFRRFVKLFPNNKFPKPEAVLKMSDVKLRSVGLSTSKVNYIKDLSRKVHKKELRLQALHRLDNEAVITELVAVKGIGKWTAEMFLMFSLNREDLFSHGDLGLRNAIIKLYGFKKPPTVEQIEKITKKWAPHRTLACRYLWRSLDMKN